MKVYHYLIIIMLLSCYVHAQETSQDTNFVQFSKMDKSTQKDYIAALKETDYSGANGAENREMANYYFSQSSSNINSNKNAFALFMKSSGVNIQGQISGDIKGYKSNGELSCANQKININDFQRNGPLSKYGLSIRDGNIFLISGNSEVPFNGEIRNDGSGRIALKDGSINGKNIKDGTGIIVVNGVIEGKASSIAGVTFKDQSSFLLKKGDIDRLFVYDAEITKVSSDTKAYLYGKAKISSYDDIDGKLMVEKGSSLKLNTMIIDNSKASKDTNLLFGKKSSVGKLIDSVSWKEDGSNYVRIYDSGIEANGDMKIRYSFAGSSGNGILSLPKKGFVGRGDAAKPGDTNYDSYALIQKIVGVKDSDIDGNIGSRTVSAIMEWQKSHGLAQTGKFDSTCLKTYLSEQGNIDISPNGGKVVVSLAEKNIDIDINGKGYVVANGEKIMSDGNHISRSIAYSKTGSSSIPSNINVRDAEGKIVTSLLKDQLPGGKETRTVTIGGKTYELAVGEAYIVAAGQTAFTKAVAPSMTSDELSKLPPEIRDTVAKAGHFGIIYVDPKTKELRVTESIWSGVSDKPFKQSHLYEVQSTLQGIYGFTNADSQKMIEGSKADGQKKIGWFFTDVDSLVGTAAVGLTDNKGAKSEYRSCVGHVCTLAEYGGVNLRKNAEYLPLQNEDKAKLQKYVEAFGIKGGVGDVQMSGIAASAMSKAIDSIDWVSKYKNYVFGGTLQSFVTPSQIIYGNMKAGTIYQIMPDGKVMMLAMN